MTATSVLNQRSGKEESRADAKRASPLRNSGSVLPPVGLRKNLPAAFIPCVTKRGQNTATTPIISQAFHFKSILIHPYNIMIQETLAPNLAAFPMESGVVRPKSCLFLMQLSWMEVPTLTQVLKGKSFQISIVSPHQLFSAG